MQRLSPGDGPQHLVRVMLVEAVPLATN